MIDLIDPSARDYAYGFKGSTLKGLAIHVLNPNGAPNTPNADWSGAHVTYHLDPSTVDSKPIKTTVEFRGYIDIDMVLNV